MKKSARMPIETHPSEPRASTSRLAYVELGRLVGEPVFGVLGPRGLRCIAFEAVEVDGLAPASTSEARSLAPIRRYLGGEAVDLDAIALDLVGTAFQRRVWAELRRIPRGRVVSYAEIAQRIGVPRATRAVGAANGANPIPIVVPCHRVVETGGGLGGYSGGLERKKALLGLEGVAVQGARVLAGQLELFGVS